MRSQLHQGDDMSMSTSLQVLVDLKLHRVVLVLVQIRYNKQKIITIRNQYNSINLGCTEYRDIIFLL